MIDKLRRVYYRRKYGPEEGDRLAAVESSVIDLYDRGRRWRAWWLDNLPPEWQIPAAEWLAACSDARRATGAVVDAIAKAGRIQTQIQSLELRKTLADAELGPWRPSDQEKLESLRAASPQAVAAVDETTQQARSLVERAKRLAHPLVEAGLIESDDPILN